jgi:copper homeostasis protein
VIALDACDARNAEAGGADRIELVSDMSKWGLSPDVDTLRKVQAATALPVRVMLRQCEGFAVGDVGALCAHARRLRAEGADEFVMGFLDGRSSVDVDAMHAVLAEIEGCRWTFHRAIDYAAERSAAWQAIGALPGLDFVLSSGGPSGVGDGVEVLLGDHRRGYRPRLIVGGVLREPHLPPLLAGGLTAFHVGTMARSGGSWAAPVDPDLVRHWRSLLTAT